MPMFARRPSTMSSSIPVEIPQNPMVGQQRQQISELQCGKFLTPHSFSCWKIRFKNQVTTAIGNYVMDQRCGDSLDELISSRSVAGENFPNFEMLDAKIASALNKIIPNSHFEKKVSLKEQRAQEEDRFLRGRQIAFMICDCFRVLGAHGTVLDYADLFTITLRYKVVRNLIRDETKPDDVMESLYKLIIRESAKLETVQELHDMEIHQKISMPNYQKLNTMVKRRIDQKPRLRNFDARHRKIETGAVAKSRKVLRCR